MASVASFKQQCPSCEAMVPIRDPGLIGRKIDCPKCKYRFLVEDPNDGADEEEAPKAKGKKPATAVTAKKPAGKGGAITGADKLTGGDKDKGKGKSKGKKDGDEGGGSSMTLIIGVGLAAVAVVAVVVGIIVFAGGDSKPSGGGGGGYAGGGDGTETPGDGTENPQPPGTTPPAGPKPSTANVTNLLPGDSKAVMVVNVDRFSGSSLDKAAFRTAGAFDKALFKQKYGMATDEVKRAITAMGGPQNGFWALTFLRTSGFLNEKALVQGLKLKDGPRDKGQIKGHKYFEVQGELDPLLTMMLSEDSTTATKPVSTKYGVHVYDTQTLVVGHLAAVEDFLEANRTYRHKSQPPTPPSTGGNPPGMGDMNPGGMGDMGVPPGSGTVPPGSGPMPPGTGTMPPGTGTMPPGTGTMPPGPGMPPGTGMPPGSGGPMPPGSGQPGDPGQGTGGGTGSVHWLTLEPDLKTMLDALDDSKHIVTVVMDGDTLRAADQEKINPGKFKPGQGSEPDPLTGTFLKMANGAGVAITDFREKRGAGSYALLARSDVDAQRMDTLLRTGMAIYVPLMSAALNINIENRSPASGGGGAPGTGTDPGMGFPMPPGSGGGFPMPPGSGGSVPVPPGSGGSVPVPPGSGPGGFPMPGDPGTTPPIGGGGEPSNSYVSVAVHSNRVVVLTADIELPRELYRQLLGEMEKYMVGAHAKAVMANHRSRTHELADGLKKYVAAQKRFPRGTLDRPLPDDRPLPYSPTERLAWTVELLPYLGHGAVAENIKREFSWHDEENLTAAVTVIPHFIAEDNPAGSYPPASRRSKFARVDEQLGAIHFVGMAGVGLDAAEYEMGNSVTAKKMGVFGYDRETKIEQISDGLEQTIALIQVPAVHKSCWLAGGGSTIRAIGDDQGAEQFECTTYQGKRGTYAIMADGKVRFIAKDMAPATFRALCTIAGGEKIDKLDEIAPVVMPPVQESELKPGVGTPGSKPPVTPPTTTPPTTTPPVTPPAQAVGTEQNPIVVSIEQLATEFNNDYSGAVAKYAKKVLRISGKVEKVTPVLSEVDLQLKEGEFAINAQLLEKDRQAGLALKPGQTVTIQGPFLFGNVREVSLRHGAIVK